MLFMPQSQLLNGRLNHIQSSLTPHRLGTVISVSTSPIPIAFNGFGVEREDNTSNFCYSLQDITRCPDLISGRNANGRTHLKLPLAGHDFSIDSAYVDTCIQARFVVGIHNVPPIRFLCSRSAVVWPLWTRVTPHWPSKRPLDILLQKCVLLFDSIPWLLSKYIWVAKDFFCKSPFVGGNGIPRRGVRVTYHQDVISSTKWVPKYSPRVQDNLTVFSRGLSST
eukprot:Gb_19340 [translate_table: standard]